VHSDFLLSLLPVTGEGLSLTRTATPTGAISSDNPVTCPVLGLYSVGSIGSIHCHQFWFAVLRSPICCRASSTNWFPRWLHRCPVTHEVWLRCLYRCNSDVPGLPSINSLTTVVYFTGGIVDYSPIIMVGHSPVLLRPFLDFLKKCSSKTSIFWSSIFIFNKPLITQELAVHYHFFSLSFNFEVHYVWMLLRLQSRLRSPMSIPQKESSYLLHFHAAQQTR